MLIKYMRSKNNYFERSVVFPGYQISWAGPENNRVYTAWAPGIWHGRNMMPIGYFKTGSEQERKNAARQCCRDHYLQLKEAC